MNKNGTVTDIAFLIITLIIIGFFCFVAYFVFGRMTTILKASPEINSTPEAVTALNSIDTANNKMDYFIFIVFIGMSLAIVITSWFLGGNPLFMILYFLVLVVLVILSMILSNVWETITEAGSYFGTTITHFPLTNNLITYLPIYIAIVGFLGIIAMFGKPFISGGDGY